MCLRETSSRRGAGNCPPKQREVWVRKRRCQREEGTGEGTESGSRTRWVSRQAQATPTFLVKRSTAPAGPLSRDGTPHTPAHPDPSPAQSPHSGATETHTKAALWFQLFYTEIHMG